MGEPVLVPFITGLILSITLHPKTEAYCFCSGSCISRKRWQLLLHPATSPAHLEVQKKAPVAQQSCPASMAMGCESTGLCTWRREEIAFAKVNSSQTSVHPRTVLVLEATLASRDHASASVSRDWKAARLSQLRWTSEMILFYMPLHHGKADIIEISDKSLSSEREWCSENRSNSDFVRWCAINSNSKKCKIWCQNLKKKAEPNLVQGLQKCVI